MSAYIVGEPVTLLNRFPVQSADDPIAGNIALTTNVSGAVYTVFGSQVAKRLTIVNNTGTTIEVQQDNAGAAFPIVNQASMIFAGIGGAEELGVRRVDQSNTPVTVVARWEF
jgi:hypothetical protein